MYPCLMALALANPLVAGEHDSETLMEARALADEFIATLKPQLKSALQSDGPAGAIAICADVAPQIADSLSQTSGWMVKRVSLKARNASRAIPDSWETEQLQRFDTLTNEAHSPIEHAETIGDSFRYLRAQRVEPVCLVCHGEQLSPDVVEALDAYYPDDTATGYQLGQVRGAISLSRTVAAPR
jgi:hypothetical protein